MRELSDLLLRYSLDDLNEIVNNPDLYSSNLNEILEIREILQNLTSLLEDEIF